MTSKRFNSEIRKQMVIDVALRLAASTHYMHVQRKQIADVLQVSPPALTYHFGTMRQLQRAVVEEAIKRKDLKIIAQAVVARDENVRKAPLPLLRRAISSFLP